MTSPAELVAAVPLAVWLLVDALAVYRAAVLVTRDSLPLFARPREYVARRWADGALGYFVECPWCVSVWLAAGVVAARLLIPDWWSLAALVLAYSAVAGFLAERD